jgi:anti-sigma-K factor RskA
MDAKKEDHFETELKSALRHQQPPSGFTARVLARLDEHPRAEPWPQQWLHLPSLRWALASALAIAVLAGGWMYRQEQQQRAAGKAARQKVMLALRITSAKLQLAEARVQRLSER